MMRHLACQLILATLFAALAVDASAQREPTPLEPDQPQPLVPKPLEAEPARPEPARPEPAQADESAQPPKIQKPKTAKDMLQTAFRLTKYAKSDRDFEKLVLLIDRAIRSGELSQENSDYAKKLKGWCHNKRGEAMLDKNRTTAAMQQFQMAVELNPIHWKALHNRGFSFAVDGKYEKAIQDFNETIRLNPRYANAWFNRGEVHYHRNDFEAAISDYEEAIRLGPGEADYYFARGNAYHRMRRHEQAMADYNRSIEIDPQNAEAYVYRGDAWADLGRYDDAAQDYRAAVKIDDQLAAGYRSIAWLMATCPDERFRDTERGVAAALKAVRLDGSQNYRYLETLAAAQANDGQFDRAAETQEKAIKIADGTAQQSFIDVMRARLARYERRQPYRQQRIARLDSESGGPN